MNIALIGSVSSTYYTLDALIRSGVQVVCALGVDESRTDSICDYRSIRQLAVDAGIPYLSFIKVSEPDVKRFLLQHKPDMLWVIGLSQLVPQELIDIAPEGGVGFHPTMLPKGRGRAPVAWTILLDQPAAANLFFLTDEPDAGDIIIQREVPRTPDDYSFELIERTNLVLAKMIEELAPALKSGDIPRTPQDHSRATHYEKRTPADGLINWTDTTEQTYRLIRAAGKPYPGAFTYCGGKKVVIWRAQPVTDFPGEKIEPGTVIAMNEQRQPIVATGDSAICLTEMLADDPLCADVSLVPGTVLTDRP